MARPYRLAPGIFDTVQTWGAADGGGVAGAALGAGDTDGGAAEGADVTAGADPWAGTGGLGAPRGVVVGVGPVVTPAAGLLAKAAGVEPAKPVAPVAEGWPGDPGTDG